jgi:hypothetical protein
VLVVGLLGGPAGAASTPAGEAVGIGAATVRDAGPLQARMADGRATNVSARDGGGTALLGGRVLWTFGDTIYAGRSQPLYPSDAWRSSTFAMADPRDPMRVTEQADATDTPNQLFPYTSAEISHNRNRRNELRRNPNRSFDPADPLSYRLALWSAAATNVSPDLVDLVYAKVKASDRGPFDFTTVGFGLASMRTGQASATRDLSSDPDGLLFRNLPPSYNINSLQARGGYLYLYGCYAPNASVLSQTCSVARASLDQNVNRATSWRWWNGTTRSWVADRTQGTAVMSGGSLYNLHVTWEGRLNAWVSVSTDLDGQTVYTSTASSPQGPWVAPRATFHPMAPPSSCSGCFAYASMAHPELTASSSELLITYARPIGFLRVELRGCWVKLSTLRGLTPGLLSAPNCY